LENGTLPREQAHG